MKKKKLVMVISVLWALTISQLVSADRYTLHVFDNSGSMAQPHGEGTRLSAARKLANGNLGSPLPGIVEYTAIYLVQGDDSGMVTDFGEAGWVTGGDWELVKNYIEALTPSDGSVMTPLAESLCYAMDKLADKYAGEGTDLRMHLYTDGNENWSDETMCNGTARNIYDFTANAADSADVNGRVLVIPDLDERPWAPATETIIEWLDPDHTKSRTYLDSLDGDMEKDWAGGVQPQSWEWRMYYRTTWGRTWGQVGHDNHYSNWTYNATWDNEHKDDPRTIMNIYSLYQEEIEEPMTSAKANAIESLEETAVLTGSDNAGLFPVRLGQDGSLKNAFSTAELNMASSEGVEPSLLAEPTVVYTSISSKEDSLFSGLSWLTGGRYSRNPSSKSVIVSGDLDKDGDVDEADMRVVLTWFGRSVDEWNIGSIDSDLLNDGFIDNSDINVVRNNWTDNNKYPPILGDTDYNWCVDNGDLSKVWQWFGRTPRPDDQAFYHADINADGAVNWDDYIVLMDHWQEGC